MKSLSGESRKTIVPVRSSGVSGTVQRAVGVALVGLHRLAVEGGVRAARREGVDLDVVVAKLLRDGPRQAHHRRLRGDVVRVRGGPAARAVQERAGPDVDDLAAALLAHVGEDGPDAEERPAHVDGEDAVPPGHVDVHEPAHLVAAEVLKQRCVVHKTVDAAEALHCEAGHCLRLLLVAHVNLQWQRLAARRGDDLRGLRAVDDVAGDHLRALLAQPAGVGLPDVPSRASHDDDLILDALHVRSPSPSVGFPARFRSDCPAALRFSEAPPDCRTRTPT